MGVQSSQRSRIRQHAIRRDRRGIVRERRVAGVGRAAAIIARQDLVHRAGRRGLRIRVTGGLIAVVLDGISGSSQSATPSRMGPDAADEFPMATARPVAGFVLLFIGAE